jgi:hypothetical protein
MTAPSSVVPHKAKPRSRYPHLRVELKAVAWKPALEER